MVLWLHRFLLVENGVVTREVVYLAAHEEYDAYIAQAHVKRDSKGKITAEAIECRYNGEYTSCMPNQLNILKLQQTSQFLLLHH